MGSWKLAATRRRFAAYALGCLSAAAASGRAAKAEASAFGTLGYDAEAASAANGALTFGRSIGVAHENPALLPMVPEQLQLGFTFIAPFLSVDLMDKPRSTDVPISIYDSDVGTASGLQDRALPTVELLARRGSTEIDGAQTKLGFGFATGFGLEHFRVGVLLVLPMTGGGDSNVTTHYDDERAGNFDNRVHFARFGEWENIVAATAGAGYEVTRWLSLGLGTEIGAYAHAKIHIYIPDAAVQDYSQTSMDTDVSLKVRPILGARVAPLDWLALGAVFRGESYFEVEAESEVTLWNYHEADNVKTIPKRTTQSIPVVFGYEPLELSLGAGVRKGPVTAQLTATYQRWSQYLDQHGKHPEESAAFPPSPYKSAEIDASAYEFSDTVAVQGSVGLAVTKTWEATVGGALYPSPVPAQVGRTSFADGALVAVTAGGRHDFALFDRKWALALGLQLWHMQDRTTYKDPSQIVDEFPDASRTLQSGATMPEAQGLQSNSPGFPGYSSGGYLLSGNLTLSYIF